MKTTITTALSIIALLLSCCALVLSAVHASTATSTISGELHLPENAVLAGESATVLVQLFQYGASDYPPSVSQVHNTQPFASIQVSNVTHVTRSYAFRFSDIPLQDDAKYKYTVLAYMVTGEDQKQKQQKESGAGNDHRSNRLMNVAGWHKSNPCAWLSSFKASDTVANRLNIEMMGVRPFRTNKTNQPHRSPKQKINVNGRLHMKKNIPVLELWGNARERGYAHGYLIAEQILDFFSYFILEGTAVSCDLYEHKWIPMFEQSVAGGANTPYYFEPELLQEASSVISGMRDSGVSLYLPTLNRDFTMLDLLAINSYIELEYLNKDFEDDYKKEDTVACTQFAFWNTQTRKVPSVYGNTIVGRNMDGELDFRRATVTNFVTFAVTPSSGSKYVSMMWAGFLGTLSGVNEHGQYLMMNYGVSSNENPEWNRVVPVNWIARQLLAYPSVPIEKANAQTALQQIQRFNAKTGGPCITGCVLFFAKPYVNGSTDSPAYVYEGDYRNGLMRLPTEADPRHIDDVILASNHYHKYGVDPRTGPHYNFGRLMYFDTLVRYQAGSSRVKSYHDVHHIKGNVSEVLTEEVLQTVAHSTTEHSIVVKNVGNKERWIYIALARLTDMHVGWDAPFLEWQSFKFEDFFSSP